MMNNHTKTKTIRVTTTTTTTTNMSSSSSSFSGKKKKEQLKNNKQKRNLKIQYELIHENNEKEYLYQLTNKKYCDNTSDHITNNHINDTINIKNIDNTTISTTKDIHSNLNRLVTIPTNHSLTSDITTNITKNNNSKHYLLTRLHSSFGTIPQNNIPEQSDGDLRYYYYNLGRQPYTNIIPNICTTINNNTSTNNTNNNINTSSSNVVDLLECSYVSSSIEHLQVPYIEIPSRPILQYNLLTKGLFYI